MKTNMKSKRKEEETLYLRVLGYRESDGWWAAHCLETDLVGYGKSFHSALKNLRELTEIQVEFALFKNQPALLDKPAPIEIIEGYNLSLRSNLQQFTRHKLLDRKRRITSIPWPQNLSMPSFVIAQM